MNNDYLNSVTPLANVTPLQNVQSLQNVKELPNVTPLTFKSNNYTPRLYTYVHDDSNEKANSLLDIILGDTQRYELLKEYGREDYEDSILIGALTLLEDKYVTPVDKWLRGEQTLAQTGKEEVLNTLIEVSEDLDIFSNLVKSQIPAAGGKPGWDSLADALGVAGYRKVYNFNTGNVLKDIAGEMLSDPLTVLELGSSLIAAGGKAAAKESSEAALKNLTNNLSDSTLKNISKATTKAAAQNGTETTYENILRYVSRKSLDEIGEANLKNITPDLVQNVMQSKGYSVFKNVSKFKASVDTFDAQLTKLVQYTTPLGIPLDFARELVKQGTTALYNNAMQYLTTKFDLDLYFMGYSGGYQKTLKNTIYKNLDLNNTVFKNNDLFFKVFKTSPEEMMDEYYKFLKFMETKNIPISDPTEQYFEYLVKHKQGFYKSYKNNIKEMYSFFRIDKYTFSDSFKEFVSAIAAGPTAIYMAEKDMKELGKIVNINTIQKYIQEHKENLFEIYNYIDNDILNFQGKHYGLSNLQDFLVDIGMDKRVGRNYKQQLSRLFEILGINIETAPNIQKVLKSRVKNKNKAIEKIIKNNKNIKTITSVEYTKAKQKVQNKTITKESQAIDKVWKDQIITPRQKQYESVIDKSIKKVDDAVKNIQADSPFVIGDTTFHGAPVEYITDPNAVTNKGKKFLAYNHGYGHNYAIHVPRIKDTSARMKTWATPDIYKTERGPLIMHNLTPTKEYVKVKNTNELAQFVMDHEYAHTKYPQLHYTDSAGKIIDDDFYEYLTDLNGATRYNEQKHMLEYVRDIIRQQELPMSTQTAIDFDRAINYDKEHAKALTKDKKYIVGFLKKSEHIMQSLDSNKGVYNDVIRWWQNIDNGTFENRLADIQISLETVVPTAEFVQLRKDLKRIEEIIHNLKSQKFKQNILNYTENLNNMMWTQLKHQKMDNIMYQYTNLSNNNEVRLLLDELANPDSISRKTYEHFAFDVLPAANMPDKANTLKKTLALTDTVRNRILLESMDLPLSFEASETLKQNLKNVLLDTIDNNTKYKNYTVAEILADDINNSANNISKRQLIKNDIKNHIRSTPLIQDRIRNAMLKNNLIDYNVVEKEITEQLDYMLDTYIKNQASITSYLDNVSLSSIYDEKTISSIANIFTDKTRYELAAQLGSNLTTGVLNEFDSLRHDFDKLSKSILDGVENIKHLDSTIKTAIHYNDFKKTMKDQAERYNLYSASIDSEMFTTKYIVDDSYTFKKENNLEHYIGFSERFKIDQKTFRGSNAEYAMFVEKIRSLENIEHEAYKFEDIYINDLRDTLIATYSRPGALFAPMNPKKYFNNIDNKTLLTWEAFTKSSISTNNKAVFYNYWLQYKHRSDWLKHDINISNADYVANLDAISKEAPYTDNEQLSYTASIARGANALEYANKYINADIMSTLHDINDLGKHKEDIVNYLESNIKEINNIISKTQEIENSTAIQKNYEAFGNLDDAFNLGKLDYGYEESKNKTLIIATSERDSAKALSFAQATPEQIAGYLKNKCDGACTFHNYKIVRTQWADGTVTLEPIQNPFNFTKKELKDAGIKIQKRTDAYGDWYDFCLTDNREHKEMFKWHELPNTHDSLQAQVTALIDNYRRFLNIYNDDNTIPSNILTVETLNQDTWNAFLNAHSDFFGTKEERKLYQNIAKNSVNTYFSGSFERLNLSVIGGYETYNIWNSMYSSDFIPHSPLITRNTMNGLLNEIGRSNKINKWLTMFFNNDFALDNPLFQTMFSEASNDEIKEFFAKGDYKTVILRQDKQGLPKVFDYYVTDRKSYNKAASIGAIMVPVETYTTMKQVINKRMVTNDLLDVYKRIVPTTYKSMYLYTAGFPFRNGLDSLLYKNLNEMGGITALPELFKYEMAASKALQIYDNIQKEVFDLTDCETFTKEALYEVLKNHTKEEQDIYYLMSIFMGSNAASGTLSNSMANFLEEYNKKHNPELRSLWEAYYEDKILFGKQPFNTLHHLSELNEHIEMTARTGLFFYYVDQNLPINDALKNVVKTHFDYGSAPDLINICERLFWFSTFPINNLNYYVNGGLTKSPMMFKLLMDTQTASWNNGEYTYEELKKTNFLAYHAMTGNLRIGKYIIKTSPSVFDFINLVTNPLGQLKERLNPIAAVTLGLAELSELNPLQSQFRLYPKQFQGNPIPSIISKIDERDWDRTLGRWRNTYIKRSWTKYPKIKKARASRLYARKYYARRYSTRVRNFTKLSTYRDAYKYYKVYKRGATYYDL